MMAATLNTKRVVNKKKVDLPNSAARSVTPDYKNMRHGLHHQQKDEPTESLKTSTAFKVCVRVRPLLDREQKHVPVYSRKSNSIVRTYHPKNKQLVHIFDSDLIYDNVGVRDR
jgi:hypothetical protein